MLGSLRRAFHYMSYYNNQPQNQFTSNTYYPNHPSQAPPAQTRRPPKCLRCRRIKQKCIFSDPNESCTSCEAAKEHCGPKVYAIEDKSERDQLDLTKKNFEKLTEVVNAWLKNGHGRTWDDVFALFEPDHEQTNEPQLNAFPTRTTLEYNPTEQYISPQTNDMISSSTSYNVNGATVFNPPYDNPNFQSTFVPPDFTSTQYFNSYNPSQYSANGIPGNMAQYQSDLPQNPPGPTLVYPPTFPGGSVPYDPSNDSNGNGPTGIYAPYTSYY